MGLAENVIIMAYTGGGEKLENEAKKGAALRTKELQTRIKGLGEQMKSLQAEGKSLMESGKGESPEMDAVIEKHRLLRGRQRFFEGAIKDLVNVPTEYRHNEENESPARTVNRARAAREKSTGEHLDELLKGELEKKSE